MKTVTIKSTYSLDPLTALEIQELAAAWGVPKSEVIRRAIHTASAQRDALARRPLTALEALEELQKEPRLSAAEARAWAQTVRRERRASHRK